MQKLKHWPPPEAVRQITGLALLATLGLFIVFQVHDRSLSPYSIISLELAWTAEQAARILANWGERGIQVARESLLIDFGYMPAYAFLFAGLTLTEARLAQGWLQRAGFALVAVPFVAWVFDLVENLALLQVLAQPANPLAGLVALAGAAATIKFVLLLAVVFYIVGAFTIRFRRGSRR